MKTLEHELYKSIGFELMKELAGSLGQEEELVLGGGQGAYQTLTLNNGMVVRFTRWRDGTMPYYIILFDKSGNYVFELDLSMIVQSGDLFTWNLKAPSNALNKSLLSKWVGDLSILDENYRETVRNIKQALDSGVNVPRNGYHFIENSIWSDLCESFMKLMRNAIVMHLNDDERSQVFKEADNDNGDNYGRQKRRRNQGRFRLNIIRLYGGKCAITGESIAQVLEAAHIFMHSKSGLNHNGNGILLRSDIHRLFDANLLAIDPKSLKLKIAKELAGTNYAKFSGKKIRCRIDGSHPDIDNIQMKWEEAEFGE